MSKLVTLRNIQDPNEEFVVNTLWQFCHVKVTFYALQIQLKKSVGDDVADLLKSDCNCEYVKSHGHHGFTWLHFYNTKVAS